MEMSLLGRKIGVKVLSRGTERQGKMCGSEHEHLVLVSLAPVALLDPTLEKKLHAIVIVQYY